MTQSVENLLAKRFIARSDVKAVQFPDGSWKPHIEGTWEDPKYIPWRRRDIASHISRESTFGHYLLNQDCKCKLFALDIDLRSNKPENHPAAFTGTWVADDNSVREFDPRSSWRDRRHPSRQFVKTALVWLSHCFADIITKDLELECAIAYSGSKGLHVYGFLPELTDAQDARDGARIVIDTMAEFKPTRGDNFFVACDETSINPFRNFSIEIFPKQTTIGPDGFGNLMGLPLGVNLNNTKDKKFFISTTGGIEEMQPIDPITALS